MESQRQFVIFDWFDTVEELTEWLDDFVKPQGNPSYCWHIDHMQILPTTNKTSTRYKVVLVYHQIDLKR